MKFDEYFRNIVCRGDVRNGSYGTKGKSKLTRQDINAKSGYIMYRNNTYTYLKRNNITNAVQSNRLLYATRCK